MSAIRPDLPASLPPASTGPTAQMRTAQAAFFRAAMGGAEAPVRPTKTEASAEPEQPRLPRPGQLLDIRV